MPAYSIVIDVALFVLWVIAITGLMGRDMQEVAQGAVVVFVAIIVVLAVGFTTIILGWTPFVLAGMAGGLVVALAIRLARNGHA